jgi:enamine deaminase RidA (YjgF/YER057c/UK114 family)
MVRHIRTDEVYALPGFSPAVALSSGVILISGQVAVGLDGQIVGRDDFQSQVEQTMQNLGAVLFAAGGSFKDVVRVGVILSDRSYLARWRELRTRYFSEPFPASTLIIAGLVSEDLLIEVEATACLPVGGAVGV